MGIHLSRATFLRVVGGACVSTPLALGRTTPRALARDRCELVELQPGYPGYEGYITGVDGVGDHECLNELEDENPRFDKSDEDRANKRAAQDLGIAGVPDSWTWENWLAIECERRLDPVSYVYAFQNAESRRVPKGTDVDRDDPRLNCGTLGSTAWMDYLRQEYGGVGYGDPVDDYQLRALVGLVYGNEYLNAPQLINAYQQYGEEWVTQYYSPGGSVLRSSWLWNRLIDWGGYFPVPEKADPADQEFILITGYYGIVAAGALAPTFQSSYLQMLQRAVEDWRYELMTGETISLRRYLESIGARDWIS